MKEIPINKLEYSKWAVDANVRNVHDLVDEANSSDDLNDKTRILKNARKSFVRALSYLNEMKDETDKL